MQRYRVSVKMDIEAWAYEQSDVEDILRDWLESFSDINVKELDIEFSDTGRTASQGDGPENLL